MLIHVQYRPLIVAIGAICLVMLSSCRSLRHIPDGKYVLTQVNVSCDNPQIKLSELTPCLGQKPNKAMSVWIYEQATPLDSGWLNRKLRALGDEPVFFEPEYIDQSVSQLRRYFVKRGYFNAEITPSVIYNRKRASVNYHIQTNQPYVIQQYRLSYTDTVIRPFLEADTLNRLVKFGSLLDEDVLASERSRTESYLRNNGFFKFSRDLISFEVDTFHGNHTADLLMTIRNPRERINDSLSVERTYQRYKISTVSFNTEPYTSFEPSEKKIDTVSDGLIRFTYHDKSFVKPQVLKRQNFILPGSIFNLYDVEKTKARLSSLNVFSLVNINQFQDIGQVDTSGFGLLNCSVQLVPTKIQSYSWELEGTTSSGDMGGAVNVIYQHRSLFGGAENFSLKLKGALGTTNRSGLTNFKKIIEYGAEASLVVPKFLIPFNADAFSRKYTPRTNFMLSYIFQERPYYTYYGANALFSYVWKTSGSSTHTITPISINVVNVPRRDEAVISSWGTYLLNMYTNHIVSAIGYTYEYRTREFLQNANYNFFKFNLETSGNSLNAYSKLSGTEKSQDQYYTILNTRYSQYVKADFDYHHYWSFNENNGVASRIFAGLAYPYGNATVIPFEKQYFGGGANSLRGWNEKCLGPGSYKAQSNELYNVTSDIKLEANLEYRLKLFWVIESALFTDVGNVWAISSADEREGALFTPSSFYKQLAVSSGTGVRLNWGFILIRLDMGVKMHSPYESVGKKWIFERGKFTSSDYAISFGIGYPF